MKLDYLPIEPKEAIICGYKKVEETYLKMCLGRNDLGNPIIVD